MQTLQNHASPFWNPVQQTWTLMAIASDGDDSPDLRMSRHPIEEHHSYLKIET